MSKYYIDYLCQELDDSLTATSTQDMRDVIGGFWVDDNGDLTKTSDCKFYIMPHMISCIEKHGD